VKELLEKIDYKKELLDSKRPLPSYTVKSIRENLLLEWTYNSNAIEGNTLTLQETKVVLEGITIGGKTLREHLEVINHREAILYVEEIVEKREELSEWQIKNIHRLVLKGVIDEYAGVYRKQNVIISGASHTPPDYMIVPDKPDPSAARVLQEALGGRFGEMRTMMQFSFQSANFRGNAKQYRDLIRGIFLEEISHVELVQTTINQLLNGSGDPG